MREAHPSYESLCDFFAGRMSSEQAAPIVSHLLSACPECQEHSAILWKQSDRYVDPVPEASDPGAGSTSTIALANEAEARAHSAAVVVDSLLELPAGQRRLFALNARQCHDLRVVDGLIGRAYELRFEDVHELVALNELALELVCHLRAVGRVDEALLNDFAARAHSHLGNGRGILRDFSASARHFHEADRLLALGSEDPLELANSLKLRIAAAFRQRRFDEALAHADRAINLFERCGDQHSVGETLLVLAAMRMDQDEQAEAMDLLDRSIEKLDPELDPHLVLGVHHNRVLLLQELGRVHEALDELRRVLPLYDRDGNRLNRLRLRGVEAKLCESLGQYAAAERAYLEARNGFFSADMAPEAAMTSLELAIFYMRHRRSGDARRVAEQTLPILQLAGLENEAVAAMLVFREATLRNRLSLELLRETLRVVEGSRS
ncbi:MAG: hypothetical protein DWQ36_24210 [Acidobacteria bacterium]|nr:MAG: hypothetical protein DWQ30_07405 [Acidobacteriota bacterium]REK00253.1 MAG: hypothetical protein DWQ36_24210 [Acidobacteriota bacterium]